MNNLFRTLTIALISLGLVVAAESHAKEIEDRKWLYAKTKNFEIRSQLSKKDTLKLLRQLEIFRHVAAAFTGVGLQESPVPTAIYAFPAGKVSRELSIDTGIAGRFIPGWRRNWIIVKDVGGADESVTIMHEYVHYLIHSYGTHNYPMWFHEGFAEYLSSMRIRSDEVIVGGVPPERVASFSNSRWIHIRRIIARDGSDDWNPERNWMFYSEAWALVHYLLNRTDQETRFNDQLRDYLQLVDAGGDSLAAFETAFGESVAQLDRDVRKYLAGKRVPGVALSAEALYPDFEPEVSQMSRQQVSLALGQFALMKGDYAKAERWYSIAAEDPILEAHALAGLGDTYKFRDRSEDALAHFERALELAPDDPLCHLDMAEFLDYRARQVEEPVLRDELIDRARKHYTRAWELDPNSPETYAMYGQTYLLKGDDYDKAVTMLEQAQRLLRSNSEIKILLAEAYLRAGRKTEAAAAAQSFLSWSHAESDKAARALEILNETQLPDQNSE